MITRVDPYQAGAIMLGAPGTQRLNILAEPEVYPASTPQTGDRPAQVATRWTTDDTGVWFEIGFTALQQLAGDAADGHYAGRVRVDLQQSVDLVTWNEGQFQDCAVTGIDNGDGTFTYWNRCIIPRLWKYVTIDLTATTTRYGKSITAIHLFGTLLALPNYPYAMPSQAATLQTDLLALGYTGAAVTTSSAALSVGIINYNYSSNSFNSDTLPVTLSGTDVTQVKTATGTNITLPNYPYAMPSQAATLQADLRAAGQSGAVVRLYGDPWTVFIPDRDTVLSTRDFKITFTPDDPYPAWDMFGTYLGNVSDNIVTGTFGNLRATSGLAPLVEAVRQFARLKVTREPFRQYIRRVQNQR